MLLGVDAPATAAVPVPVASPSGRPTLLFVGVRAGYKNFDGFVRAVAASPMLRKEVEIVAFGGGAFTTGEAELIAKLRLTPRIRQVAGDDMALAAHYAAAAALVYPSRYEGFGLPPLEAMMHDCPVVCSNTSSLPEVVEDAAETFDPADEAAMARAIETVLSSEKRRRTLVARGRERVRVLTWQKCARETLAVYQTVRGQR
ncbi:glycosyltransferase [Sphingomonas sp. BT-65]|nr:glycosyltransferase [Sphingomonas sp. BT-65]